MTPEERNHCEHKSATLQELHHYKGLHSARAGCTQCVKAFLADGGDPNKGTAHHKKWTLVAWAEYAHRQGHVSGIQLEAVRSVVASHAETTRARHHARFQDGDRAGPVRCVSPRLRSRSPRRPAPNADTHAPDMPTLVSVAFESMSTSAEEIGDVAIGKLCKLIADKCSASTQNKTESPAHFLRCLGLQEVAVKEVEFLQRKIHPRRNFNNGQPMKTLIDELVQHQKTPQDVEPVRLLKMRNRFDHIRSPPGLVLQEIPRHRV